MWKQRISSVLKAAWRLSSSTSSSPSPAAFCAGFRILSRNTLAETKWLRLVRIGYIDEKQEKRTWDSAERTTKVSPTSVDAVAMLATLRKKKESSSSSSIENNNNEDFLVLVAQFRPPLGKVCVETPAGLLEPDETIEAVAERELREETGFVGRVTSVSPVLSNDPGMSDATHHLVTMEIDGSLPENINPKPDLQGGEHIQTILVPLSKLVSELTAMQKDKGWSVDAKIFNYAMGIQQARAK